MIKFDVVQYQQMVFHSKSRFKFWRDAYRLRSELNINKTDELRNDALKVKVICRNLDLLTYMPPAHALTCMTTQYYVISCLIPDTSASATCCSGILHALKCLCSCKLRVCVKFYGLIYQSASSMADSTVAGQAFVTHRGGCHCKLVRYAIQHCTAQIAMSLSVLIPM
jgi:hypothetical protein